MDNRPPVGTRVKVLAGSEQTPSEGTVSRHIGDVTFEVKGEHIGGLYTTDGLLK